QGKATASLVKGADDVRRLARQTARALAEQTDALSSCAVTANRQTTTLQTMTRVTADQAALTAQTVQSVAAIRGRAKEIAAGAGHRPPRPRGRHGRSCLARGSGGSELGRASPRRLFARQLGRSRRRAALRAAQRPAR